MGFFSNLKINLGFGGGHHDNPHKEKPSRHHHHNSNHHEHHHEHDAYSQISPRERAMVEDGLGVFAWIEKSGIFYNGDIPGVSGIMSARMADSFEECFEKLKENINDSVAASFSSFRQKESLEEIKEEHPDARIVFIPIHKK